MTQLGVVSTVPAADPAEHEGAEIVLHPNGKFLCASNRGHSNTIAIFRIALTRVGVEGIGSGAGELRIRARFGSIAAGF
jgi:6-phosphogluconolactonase (cycloisomerase 2 family)